MLGTNNEKLKVGVIGCGAISQRRHLPEYAARGDVEIVALCDPNLERAKEVAQAFGVPHAFDRYADLLELSDIQAVSVCTPNHLHTEVSVEAMRKGKHVLCEKPMAVNIDDARRMIAMSESTGMRLMIGHNQRLMPVHRKAKEVLRSGRLGRVLTFASVFGHGGPENWSIDGKGSWFFRKGEAALGVTADLGIHKIDLMHWLLEDDMVEVKSIYGGLLKSEELDDNALLLLRTANGTIGTITLSWTYVPNEINSTILHCERGTIRIGTDPQFGVIVELADGQRELYEVGAMQSNNAGGQFNSGIIDHFVDGILTGVGHDITGADGLKALEVIMAAFEAEKALI